MENSDEERDKIEEFDVEALDDEDVTLSEHELEY